MTSFKSDANKAINEFKAQAKKDKNCAKVDDYEVIKVLGQLDEKVGSPLRFLETMISNRYGKKLDACLKDLGQWESLMKINQKGGTVHKGAQKAIKSIKAVDKAIQSLQKQYSTTKYETIKLVDWRVFDKDTAFKNIEAKDLEAYHFKLTIVADENLTDGIKKTHLARIATDAMWPSREKAREILFSLNKHLDLKDGTYKTRSEQIRACQDATKRVNKYLKEGEDAAINAINVERANVSNNIKIASSLKWENISNLVCGTISAAAAVISGVASAGLNAMSYVQGVQALIKIGGSLYEMYQNADFYAQEIKEHGETMIARMEKAKVEKKFVAQEFASFVGIPLLTTSKAMNVSIRSLKARLPKLDKQCSVFLKRTHELIEKGAEIKDASKSKKLGQQTTKLLDQIGDLQIGKQSYEKTIETGKTIMVGYDAKKPLTVKKFDKLYQATDKASNANTTLKSLATIAKAIVA